MKKKVVNIETANDESVTEKTPQNVVCPTFAKSEKRFLRMAACFALLMVLTQLPAMQVFASGDYAEVTAPFDTLTELFSAIISSVGYIITLWGIGEWGLSYQGSEGTMQAQAFKRIGGGFVMVMAPQILAILI